MRTTVAAFAVAVAGLAAPALSAADHIVAPEAAHAQLRAAAAERQANLDAVDGALRTPLAAAAAARVGADLQVVRARAATLDDAELADLAVRAAALQQDPVAGLDPDIKMLLMIFLIVAIVILVLRAV